MQYFGTCFSQEEPTVTAFTQEPLDSRALKKNRRLKGNHRQFSTYSTPLAETSAKSASE
jgi:hypothetical protein